MRSGQAVIRTLGDELFLAFCVAQGVLTEGALWYFSEVAAWSAILKEFSGQVDSSGER